ncbi:formyltransferase [Variovorax sp. PBL-E5]|uniref:formyltransferase n=1 Tax=Variovorax sp. PBL-E5 TaxID=434014 RepID=UPI0013169F43|nr:formyltransferase [Variovorax sp. PBL-E5]VTU30516.1 Bifunctional polymyxin resistance protein ArnA [Variovorax sp. PBL-E5]
MTDLRRPALAIVFAYHDVGVRCLRVLLDAGVEVPLVITHEDAPGETIWFGSVAAVAAEYGVPCVTPADPHAPELIEKALAIGPDFVFSFYYRQMLRPEWLTLPRRGAFNMHGSLLPRYRGRAPVNWAVIHGESETGATLHRMNEKPDNGAIVDQCAVPILANDTAREVFAKVTVAAEIVMARSLPGLIDGTSMEHPQRLSLGRYFGGRRPEDGRIPYDADAAQIHNLVRALAPPYPAAFVQIAKKRVFIERTLRAPASPEVPGKGLRLASDGTSLWLVAADGSALRVLAARCDGDAQVLAAHDFESRFGARCIAVDA